MSVRSQIPFPAFDAVLLFYNRMHGQLDGALKKLQPRMTISGLQVLTEIAKARELRSTPTQARIARAIGVTPSSLVTTIKGLEANGLITVDRSEFSKTHGLAMTAVGLRAWRRGLVAREDVLAEINDALPAKYRHQFLLAAKAANEALDRKQSTAHQVNYLKSLKKHTTRAIVISTRGLKARPSME